MEVGAMVVRGRGGRMGVESRDSASGGGRGRRGREWSRYWGWGWVLRLRGRRG